MRILITGGAGFIGKHVTHALLTQGHDVLVADLQPFNESSEFIGKPKGQFIYRQVDILSATFTDDFMEFKPDIVIHNAAQTDVGRSMDDRRSDATLNITGTIAILDLCLKIRVKNFIFASSAAVYGVSASEAESRHETDIPEPLSFYGLSKWAAEQYILKYASLHSLPYMILRYSNVYGNLFGEHQPAGNGVISHFIQSIREQKHPIIYGDGEQTRDFIYIQDIVKANLVAMLSEEYGIFNISSGLQTSISTLYNELSLLIDSKLKPCHKEAKLGDIKNSCLDNEKARLILEWTPTYSIRDGLGEMLQLTPFQSY